MTKAKVTSITSAKTKAKSRGRFEKSSEPPHDGSEKSPSVEWDSLRDAALSPRYVSTLDDTPALRAEFLAGAKALGLVGRKKTLQPQQLLLADVLNSGQKFTGVMMPRRSLKTTTILAWLIGRGLSEDRDEYLMAYAVMTSQKKSRDRFMKDVVPVLQRVYPNAATRPFRIRTANGFERLEFDNGSILQFLGPSGDGFRSDAFDVIVMDEGGEPEPEEADEAKSAALPTMDTRPDAQLVVAGTAGKFTAGNLLYEALEPGRAGEPRNAILEYSAPESTTDEELSSWEPTDEHPEGHVRELVLASHPGIGGLTPQEAVRDNYERLGVEKFAREYLGLFTETGTGKGIVDMGKWQDGALTGVLPEPPADFALVIVCHPDQLSASIVAVWREDGTAHLLLLEHRRGTTWLADRALHYSRKYRKPIIHDTIGVVMVEVEVLNRANPRPRLLPQTYVNVRTAAGLIIKEIKAGHVVHYNQPEMNEAAAKARKRPTGPTAWALGRGLPEDDITPFEGAALGLRYYDESSNRSKLSPDYAFG